LPGVEDDPHLNTFDAVDTQERFQLDDRMMVEVLGVFLQDLPQKRFDLSEATTRWQTEKLIRLAHTLKGTASNLAARGVAEAAQELESVVVSGDRDGTNRCLHALFQQLDQAQAVMNRYIASHSPSH